MRPWHAAAAVAVAALGLRLALFTGFQVSDDLSYTRLAWRIREGTFEYAPNPYATRVGLLAPMAAAFAVAGPTIGAAVSWNLAASLATIVLAFAIGRRLADARTGLVAAILVATLPVNLYHATEVHADLPMAAWMGVAAWAWLAAENRPAVAFAGGLALGAAHLTKEPAFFLLAFVVPHGLRVRRRALAGFLAGFALVGLAEAAVYGLTTGDWMARITSVRGGHLHAIEQIHYGTASAVARRLFVDIPAMLWNPVSGRSTFFGLFYVAFAGAAALGLRRRDPAARLAFLWWLALFLCFDLFPIRLWPFRPAMVDHPRILEPMTIPAAVVIARGAALLARPRIAAAAVGLVALVGVLASVRLHQEADAARCNLVEAHRWLASAPSRPVVAGERACQALEFLDGFRELRPCEPWEESPPAEPAWVVLDHRWLRHDEVYYGVRPPAWTAERTTPAFESVPTRPGSWRRGLFTRTPDPDGRLEIREWTPSN